MESVLTVVLPLGGPPLYARLGLGWGNSLLAFVALVFAPLPVFILKYGENIREAESFQVKY